MRALKRSIIFSTVVCSLCVFAHARIITVPGMFQTIQEAIDFSVSSDTILVEIGEYEEALDFKGKNVMVTSRYLFTGDLMYLFNTIIKSKEDTSGTNQNTRIRFEGGETGQCALLGFTIINEYISIRGASPTLSALIIKGIPVNDTFPFPVAGLDITRLGDLGYYTLSNLILENVAIRTRISRSRLYLVNSWIYNNCRVSQSPASGYLEMNNIIFDSAMVHMSGTSSPQDTMIITNSSFRTSNMSLGGTGNLQITCVVRESEFENSRIYMSGTGFLKVNCIIEDNSFNESHMSFGGTGEAKITNSLKGNRLINSLVHFGGTGECIVTCDFSKNIFTNTPVFYSGTGQFKTQTTYLRNIFHDCTDSVFSFNAISSCKHICTIENNTIVGNDGGIFINDTASVVTILNTILWDNMVSLGNVEKSRITYSLIDDTAYIGQNGNIGGEPLFLNYSQKDFNLTENSPCIDAGDPNSPKDPDSTRCDIGALPYMHGTIIANTMDQMQIPTLLRVHRISRNAFNILIDQAQALKYSLYITNLAGRIVWNTEAAGIQNGRFRTVYDATNLSRGIYVLHVKGEYASDSRTIVID